MNPSGMPWFHASINFFGGQPRNFLPVKCSKVGNRELKEDHFKCLEIVLYKGNQDVNCIDKGRV